MEAETRSITSVKDLNMLSSWQRSTLWLTDHVPVAAKFKLKTRSKPKNIKALLKSSLDPWEKYRVAYQNRRS